MTKNKEDFSNKVEKFLHRYNAIKKDEEDMRRHLYEYECEHLDAVSLSVSVDGFLAGGGGIEFEVGLMSNEGFFFTYTSRAGFGVDPSWSVNLNKSYFSGSKEQVSMNTYTGDSYFINGGISFMNIGYSRSFDGKWNTMSVGVGSGYWPCGLSFGCERKY